eukprot:scaffold90162_cov56-Phaeocystis_antarctica.AAC.5
MRPAPLLLFAEVATGPGGWKHKRTPDSEVKQMHLHLGFFVPSFLPKLGRVWVAAAKGLSHDRRPPGGRPRTVAGGSRARPQAAACQAAGAAARPGSGQQGGPRGAGGAEG